jgi:hypothetical protein
MKNLIHRVPLCSTDDRLISSEELNSQKFDFRNHFSHEAISTIGRFMVCYKSKPWMINDLMIIDADNSYVRSPSELNDAEFNDLSSIVKLSVAELLDNPEITKIIVGANINPLLGKEDHESIWRLHVHVCGLTKDEVDKMEELDEKTAIFEDEIITRFKKDIGLLEDFEIYAYGARKDLGDIEKNDFMNEVRSADLRVREILSKYHDNFSVISYSFCVLIESGKASLYFSPKSRDGRGVLEAIGIVLNRDKLLAPEKEFTGQRDKFLKRVQDKLMKIESAKIGELKLEEK